MPKFLTMANVVASVMMGHWVTNNFAPSTGQLVFGPNHSYNLPFMVCLTSTVSDAATAGTDITGAQQPLAGAVSLNTGSGGEVASGGTMATNATISFSNMPACTWADLYTRDSTSSTPQKMLFRGGTSLNKTVNSGDTVLISSGNLSVDSQSNGNRLRGAADVLAAFFFSGRDATWVDPRGSQANTGQQWIGESILNDPIDVHLTTGVNTATTLTPEVSGGSYAAQHMTDCTTPSSGQTQNSSAISFSNMPACTLADLYFAYNGGINEPNGTQQFVGYFRGGSSLAKTINAGDTVLINAGDLSLTES